MDSRDENDPQPAPEPEFPPIPHPPPPPPIPEVLLGSTGSAKPRQPQRGTVYSDTTRSWGIAMDFVFTILGALFLGYFIDRWLGSAPRATITGLVLGFSFALWRIIRRTLADERKEKAEREKARSGSQ
jgi:F0F1-type ATP synthase assembly protein I